MKRKGLVRGVGINDADYAVTLHEVIGSTNRCVWTCPIYLTWTCMLARCYSEKYQLKYPTYIGCSVCSEWLTFSNFRKWMLAQDYQGKHLDKDILFPGNRIYSPETCVFVTGKLNTFLNDTGSSRGEHPIGVCWHKRTAKFVARCSNPFSSRSDSLGYFNCPNEAHEAWKAKKHEHACRYAGMQTDQRIAEALRKRFSNTGEAN